jgi:polyisoprenoid-binding protein YceI
MNPALRELYQSLILEHSAHPRNYGPLPTATHQATLDNPLCGDTITVQANGELTLHGVTQPITITLESRYDGKNVQVVGHAPVAFSDYGIDVPTASELASVDDHGELELKLFFVKEG